MAVALASDVQFGSIKTCLSFLSAAVLESSCTSFVEVEDFLFSHFRFSLFPNLWRLFNARCQMNNLTQP